MGDYGRDLPWLTVWRSEALPWDKFWNITEVFILVHLACCRDGCQLVSLYVQCFYFFCNTSIITSHPHAPVTYGTVNSAKFWRLLKFWALFLQNLLQEFNKVAICCHCCCCRCCCCCRRRRPRHYYYYYYYYITLGSIWSRGVSKIRSITKNTKIIIIIIGPPAQSKYAWILKLR